MPRRKKRHRLEPLNPGRSRAEPDHQSPAKNPAPQLDEDRGAWRGARAGGQFEGTISEGHEAAMNSEKCNENRKRFSRPIFRLSSSQPPAPALLPEVLRHACG